MLLQFGKGFFHNGNLGLVYHPQIDIHESIRSYAVVTAAAFNHAGVYRHAGFKVGKSGQLQDPVSHFVDRAASVLRRVARVSCAAFQFYLIMANAFALQYPCAVCPGRFQNQAVFAVGTQFLEPGQDVCAADFFFRVKGQADFQILQASGGFHGF